MKKLFVAVVISLLFVFQNSFAEDAEKNIWKGEVELGLVSTSGNTETETINAKAKVVNERDKWIHTVNLDGFKTSDDLGITAKRVGFSAKSDYKYNSHDYFFMLVAYENDKFSGFDYQTSEAIGYGRRVIEEKDMHLNLEIGPGARQSTLETGVSENETTIWGGANYEWVISKTSKFTEVITVESGDDSTISKSVTTLTSQVAGSLAMKISFTIKNNSEVPAGVEKKDTETAVTLIYSF